jgi:hypothetical protein
MSQWCQDQGVEKLIPLAGPAVLPEPTKKLEVGAGKVRLWRCLFDAHFLLLLSLLEAACERDCCDCYQRLAIAVHRVYHRAINAASIISLNRLVDTSNLR